MIGCNCPEPKILILVTLFSLVEFSPYRSNLPAARSNRGERPSAQSQFGYFSVEVLDCGPG